MKKLTTLFALVLVLSTFSCTNYWSINTDGFSTYEDYILYQNDTVAKLCNIEYSLDNGKFVKEATFKLLNMKYGDKGKAIIYYVSKKHKNWEIELDYPIDGFVFK